MRLASLELLLVSMPFRLVFRHSLAERDSGANVVVRARDTDGHVGYGECVPRDYVSGETPRSAMCRLSGSLSAMFLERDFPDLDSLVRALREAGASLPRNRHAAFCALELALLDLAGKRFCCCAGEVLGPVVAETVEYSGVVSADGPDRIGATLEALRAAGVRHVKVKVGADEEADLEVLRDARAVLGDECSLRVDANCAWGRDEALERLAAMAPLKVRAVEQPLSAEDLEGLVWLTERSHVPVILDESVVSVDDAQRLADACACHAFNVRISKCGGLLRSAEVRAVARRAGLGCMLGAQVGETAILSAAGRQFGTRCRDLWFLEGSYGDLLLERDIARADLTVGHGGKAAALRGPGLGITVDEHALAPHVKESVLVGDGECRFYPGSS